MVAGIPTTYRYNAMRSRLEARWAAFFDLLGWKWTYEPLDADGYIPDFLIHGKYAFFVEVGPCLEEAEYRAKAVKADLSAQSLGRDLLVVGVTPLADFAENNWHPDDPVAGLLGEFWSATAEDRAAFGLPPSSEEDQFGLTFDAGMWARCSRCQSWAVFQSVMNYACRPCGHHNGGNHQGYADPRELADLWARAGSVVQWKPGA